MNKKIIVADASPLIAFGRINNLPLLKQLFGTVIVPEAVINECLSDIARPGAAHIQKAINEKIIKLHVNPKEHDHSDLFDFLGVGETNAITLALQLDTGLLIDEKLGRIAAKKLKIPIIGTAGVLLLAKRKKIIKKVTPVINALKQEGYYISDDLIAEILKRAKED